MAETQTAGRIAPAGRGAALDPRDGVAIQASGLTCDFGSLRAVDHASFEVASGTIFGFLGPNGAGKTTTIRLLLGLLEPTAGQARVLGHDLRTEADAIRQRTGALLEHHGLYERLTAMENLEFYGRVWRLPPARRRARIEELLTHFGLWERRGEATVRWSHGMKQKLAVARALLHAPSLVFLDEPTAGLDPVAAAALRDDLAALASREGTTVFLTTHNLTEAERLCHTVAVIRAGKIVALGRPDELRASAGAPQLEVRGRGLDERAAETLRGRPEVAGVRAGPGFILLDLRSADVDPAPLVRLLVEAGASVEEVRRQVATLEEVFLDLVVERNDR